MATTGRVDRRSDPLDDQIRSWALPRHLTVSWHTLACTCSRTSILLLYWSAGHVNGSTSKDGSVLLMLCNNRVAYHYGRTTRAYLVHTLNLTRQQSVVLPSSRNYTCWLIIVLTITYACLIPICNKWYPKKKAKRKEGPSPSHCNALQGKRLASQIVRWLSKSTVSLHVIDVPRQLTPDTT